MKSYKDMAKDVLQRIDETNAAKKRKKRIIIKTIIPICCIFFITLIGLNSLRDHHINMPAVTLEGSQTANSPQQSEGNKPTTSNGQTILAEQAYPTYGSLEELVESIKAAHAFPEKMTDKEAAANLSDITHIYMPAATIEGYELWKIEVMPNRIGYWYVPEKTDNMTFDYTTGIEYSYRRNEDYSLQDFANDSNCTIDGNGLIYLKRKNEIYFSVGSSSMYIKVPDKLNDYDVLKSYCIATKITIS